MLTAVRIKDKHPVFAFVAGRHEGPFECPECESEVLLRKGEVRVHHFAHKPPVRCWYGQGETDAHRKCKVALWQYLSDSNRIRDAAMEQKVGTIRPDLSFSLYGRRVGIEVQRSSLTREHIYRRTMAYARNDIAVLWISPVPNFLGNEPFRPKDWQIWLHGLTFGRVYYWRGGAQLEPVHYGRHHSYVESRTWYNEYGDEQSAGGYERLNKSTRIAVPARRLLPDVDFRISRRRGDQFGGLEFPECSLFMDTLTKWW